jgi:hypothetical protein
MTSVQQDRPRRYLSSVVTLLAVLLVLASPVLAWFGLFALALWAATGTWDFEGDRGLYHWMFVKGKYADRLGFVEHVGHPPRYSVGLQEGTFPGWTVVAYDSKALPAAILDTYSKRCGDLRLKINKGPVVSEYEPHALILVCEIEPYIDAEFYAERKPQAPVTSVSMRVWGRD